jgi:DNA-binding transcriptional regulator YdaS (Cro superfamily)
MGKPTLKEWLRLTGTSTEVLAKKSVSRATISDFLNGKKVLALESALLIWKATDGEVDFISLFPKWEKYRLSFVEIEKETL